MSEECEQIVPDFAANDISFSFESKEADLMAAAEVIDFKNKAESRRNLQAMGLVIVLWMFVPNLFTDPGQIMNWVMVALSLGVLWMIWKMPEKSNRKFAENKMKNSPVFEMTVRRDGIDVKDGSANYFISFENGVSVYEYNNIIAVLFDKNHLLAIPKDQLGEETCQRLVQQLRGRLGDLYEKIESTRPTSMFTRKKKA